MALVATYSALRSLTQQSNHEITKSFYRYGSAYVSTRFDLPGWRHFANDSGTGAKGPTTTESSKKRGKTPIGKLDELEEGKHPYQEKEPLHPWPGGVNPHTGEVGGPRGPEPTRYGDWERKGRVTDF